VFDVVRIPAEDVEARERGGRHRDGRQPVGTAIIDGDKRRLVSRKEFRPVENLACPGVGANPRTLAWPPAAGTTSRPRSVGKEDRVMRAPRPAAKGRSES